MKTLLKSLCSALLMYSKIPAPRVAWTEENRRYSLCFFPLVGMIIGGILFGWWQLCNRFVIGNVLMAAVACVIPLLVCGGIHLDGYCDVLDAHHSHQPRERKLEIMKDPHIGSFAVIGLCVYFLLQFGLFSEILLDSAVAVTACGYTLSRALSGLAAVTFKSAKSDGALYSFTKPAHKRGTVITLSLTIAIICAVMLFIDPFLGAAAIVAAGLVFVFYRVFSYKQFGGITGDLAGFFLQICELAILAAVIIAQAFVPFEEIGAIAQDFYHRILNT